MWIVIAGRMGEFADTTGTGEKNERRTLTVYAERVRVGGREGIAYDPKWSMTEDKPRVQQVCALEIELPVR